ncbi:MAG: butyrate kinase [Chlorobi bacterium]|nr:butyrate kinase [Chlorobiota bacterium]
MSPNPAIYVINPGSTSTKLAVFAGDRLVHAKSIKHGSAKGISPWESYTHRYQAIKRFFATASHKWPPDAVVGRGGLLKSVRGGTYIVTQAMLNDARNNLQGKHASNLGCVLADDLAREFGVPAYIVDPISTDEFEPVARLSGHPLIERRALSHALSIHAVARAGAKKIGKEFKSARVIVAHLGGGISIAPVRKGRIIDVNDASSAGPFSPDRTGGLPLQPFISLCFSGKYSESEIRKVVMGNGGLKAYLGTPDLEKIERRITKGDKRALLVINAMCYQIAKEIGSMATVLEGKVDCIALTGGMVNSTRIVRQIRRRIRWIAPVFIFKGEHEMRALAEGALRVLTGRERARIY